jgi:hypothetical protein
MFSGLECKVRVLHLFNISMLQCNYWTGARYVVTRLQYNACEAKCVIFGLQICPCTNAESSFLGHSVILAVKRGTLFVIYSVVLVPSVGAHRIFLGGGVDPDSIYNLYLI